jgi:hypothetical protein
MTALALPLLAALACDLSNYKEQPGLRAQVAADTLHVTWSGARNQELRVSLAIDAGAPVIRELAVRKPGSAWSTLGANLRPDFTVTTGRRRISEQQLAPVRALGRTITPELVDREKWNVFWDAPLVLPGSPRTNPGVPRTPEEIRRAGVSYQTSSCAVTTNGARLEVSFPGLALGIFSGRLQFTVYKGANLLRQEAIAATSEPSVAYKYSAGLRGFRIDTARRVVWRDVARGAQKIEFGGAPNTDPIALRARNRLAVLETPAGSLAVFPPPHKFFWAREIELNLGYVYYQKLDGNTFALGVRHNDREEGYRPYGFADEVWQRRVSQSRNFAQGNFALYNAPPGTQQRMAVYYYLSGEPPATTADAVLAFTHDDRYKPLPGYQVAISHFHTHFNEQIADAGSLDFMPPWVPTFRALGINIAMMSDFHSDAHPKDPGPLRLKEQKIYFEGCRRHSDRDFLILPGEEPDAHFGGHYSNVFPRPVYWTHVRQPGQPLVENHPEYGKVYHVGSPADELEMLRLEGGLVWQAHPRTKGSTLYPDASRETEYFRSDRFLGGAFQSLPVDLSEARLCEKRCLGTLDDMNNWTGPKYVVAEGDTYAKFPDDETYPHLIVNYVKLERLPRYDEDWSPITKAMRAGEFFVTSGEVLIRHFSIGKAAVTAEIEWTFPLEFVELVWGDGDKTDRQILAATDRPAHSSHRFEIPFDRTGKKWVRFAAWDSAGNGAFSQPVHLSAGSP